LTQQQGRIFALLYLSDRPLALEEIANELEQSRSNVSLNIRVLVEWHLVRRKPIPGSRKDHYEAANDFFRAMQEIFERRFRWTVRQVVSAVKETKADAARAGLTRDKAALLNARLDALASFFSLVDAGIGMFTEGKAFPADQLRNVVPLDRAGRGGRTGR
jgi:DNA-binding transcriptional regulator GbsR (MarR family)